MKVENINNEEGRHYLQTWIKALNLMLGWSESETIKWAEKWEEGLNDDTALFFNRTEGYYILNLLIPESLSQKLSSKERHALRETLLRVIEKDGSFCYRKLDFDWHAVKRRVDHLFAEVGQFKRISRKGAEHFLRDYQKHFLVKKPAKEQKKYLRELLKKTYVL